MYGSYETYILHLQKPVKFAANEKCHFFAFQTLPLKLHLGM